MAAAVAASYADYVCTNCQRLGFDGSSTAAAGSSHAVVACSVCGAIDERATYIRNTAHTSHIFGTIHDPDGSSEIQFGDPRERRHEAYINELLHIYLVDPRSRFVERPAGHFIPGVRNLYNRIRTEQARTKGYVRVQTKNTTQQVKYHLVSAIRLVIQQSNVALVHSHFAHHRASMPPSGAPLSRGDGSVMAPSLRAIFARAQALGSDHPGYLDRLSTLKLGSKRVERLFVNLPTTIDVVLSQVLVLSNHLKLLIGLPVATRKRLLSVNAIKAEAVRTGKTTETAEPDDFVLDTECWDYMSGVIWDDALEMALGLYNAQQVVSIPDDSFGIQHAGMLLREREQYIRFSANEERRKGRTAPVEVEQAMKEWVRRAKASGTIPAQVTKAYLGSLGFHGDPRRQDLEGRSLNAEELDAELAVLFKYGPEKLSSILATPAEAKEKEQQLLDTNVWSFPRGVQESAAGAVELATPTLDTPNGGTDASDDEVDAEGRPEAQPRGNFSKRINFNAIRNLVFRSDDEGSEGGEGGEVEQDINVALQQAVGDTLLGALGDDIGGQGDDDSEAEDGEDGEADV
ncbi:hypothetical protein Q8F55_008804 [Vanrija albida]|uniref:Uncharacterized protein n=1 Tax=Vanrija albida TaxID=181172 RepID=A0ABR3PRU6_9TREE